MTVARSRLTVAGWAAAAAIVLALSGCSTEADPPTAPDSGSSEETDTGAETDPDAESGNGDLVTVSGTGVYVIGVDIPYGGFQLMGEPTEQPAGCTWAIKDADGGVSFENQGSYVFLTDIVEAVTFETSGCPEWEQFE